MAASRRSISRGSDGSNSCLQEQQLVDCTDRSRIFFRFFFIAQANQKIRILALGRGSMVLPVKNKPAITPVKKKRKGKKNVMPAPGRRDVLMAFLAPFRPFCFAIPERCLQNPEPAAFPPV
jgi:hypothetical protein